MEEYKNYISNLAKLGSNVVFYNKGNMHAALVMSTIFDYSKSNLKIYAGNLNGGVSDQACYRESLDQYLRNGGKVEIILNDYDPKNANPKIFNILKYHKLLNDEVVSVKSYKGKLIDNKSQHEVHFTVSSSLEEGVLNMYRLENNIKEYTASGNFNDIVTSELLGTIFGEVSNDTDKCKVIEF